ncbi:MAG TPA: hypothetical protein VFL62_02350 [Bradyrhizobium sp.]|uniref:hypothetical protein n=1 Tax=Bradyrhizobium sp. TaxID=376 RepID=UPI002D7FA78A|nr:hypothetical protein [Bradyrhizobium sp.]HET7885046.1 hypothetical protein [Bradyrhizobium sp.]
MSDDIPLSPPIYEDPDAALYRRPSPATEAIDVLKAAIERLKAAIDAGRQPGMPLSVLSNVAREAPLGSLALAFLLGVAIGRRSR